MIDQKYRENNVSLSLKTRFILIVVLLLCSCAVMLLAAKETVEALKDVHYNQYLAQKGDVQLIQPWMTLSYIAHIYHVPENILLATLHLKRNTITLSTSIGVLASQKKEPTTVIIHQLQIAIMHYRKIHPQSAPPPSPPPHATGTPVTQRGER